MLRVFEAFSGVGSQHMALKNIGIDHQITYISEVDEQAILSYAAIHHKEQCDLSSTSEEEMKYYMERLNIPLNKKGERINVKGKRLRALYEASVKSNNVGDVSKIDPTNLADFDLLTYSFPCQDISHSGQQKGLVRGQTRSGLLYEVEKIIESKMPKYLLLENVKALVSKTFMPDFKEWLHYLETLGYTNYWKVLNAKDYGVPQNRERVFVVSILNPEKEFAFEQPRELETSVLDLLENAPDKYFLTKEQLSKIRLSFKTQDKLKEILQVGMYDSEKRKNPQMFRVYDPLAIAPTILAKSGGHLEPCIYLGSIRGRYINNPSLRVSGLPTAQHLEVREDPICGTLTTVGKDNMLVNIWCIETPEDIPTIRPEGMDMDIAIRKLTPLECWRLMGFSDEDFVSATSVTSHSQLYRQAGNSIVVPVLESLFRSMFLN